METKFINNKEEAPLKHYLEEFKALDPILRAKELGIPYENEVFELTMFGSDYKISWPDGEIKCDDPNAIAMNSASGRIMLIRYLVCGKALPFGGKYMSFRELPWGEVYIKPFTGRCVNRIAYKFNSSPDKFIKAAEALGGKRIDHSDAGFQFKFIDNYSIIFLLWAADEEFPPNAQIEFSDNFAAGFSAEDDVVVAELMIGAISRKMSEL